MGHLIFIILHLIAFIFIGYVFLFITIPLHLIYAILQGKSDRSLKRKCPYCAEMVKVEAIVCKHCGKDLEKFEGKKEEHIVTLGPSVKHGKVFFLAIILFAMIMTYFIINKPPDEKGELESFRDFLPERPNSNSSLSK